LGRNRRTDEWTTHQRERLLCLLYTNFSPNSTCTFYDTLRTPTITYELLHKQPARTGTCIHLRYPYDSRTIHVRYTYDRIGSDRIGSDRIGSNHSLWFDAGTYDVRNGDRDLKKGKRQKENNTWDSNVVPHRSTNQARTCLTSLSGREAVLSCWYGRSQNFNLSQPLQSNISFYQISQSIKYAMEKVPGTV
jgi:hypothetical protein